MKRTNNEKQGDESINKLTQVAQKNYLRGNFYAARAMARKILSSSPQPEQKQSAQRILMLTSIDKLALLAGLACLVFTAVVALMVGY